MRKTPDFSIYQNGPWNNFQERKEKHSGLFINFRAKTAVKKESLNRYFLYLKTSKAEKMNKSVERSFFQSLRKLWRKLLTQQLKIPTIED
jgi:hypothetical protein